MNYQEIKELISTDFAYASAQINRSVEADPYMSMYLGGENLFEEIARHRVLQYLMRIDENALYDEATKLHWFKEKLCIDYRESKQNVNRPGRKKIQALLLEQVQHVTSHYHRHFFDSEIDPPKT